MHACMLACLHRSMLGCMICWMHACMRRSMFGCMNALDGSWMHAMHALVNVWMLECINRVSIECMHACMHESMLGYCMGGCMHTYMCRLMPAWVDGCIGMDACAGQCLDA
jgi:hypothetical protein